MRAAGLALASVPCPVQNRAPLARMCRLAGPHRALPSFSHVHRRAPLFRGMTGTLRGLHSTPPRAVAGAVGGALEEVDFDAKDINAVSLIGNAGNDAEVKYLSTGNKLVIFNMALLNKRDQPASWVQVEAWGDLADAAAGVQRGSSVLVKGRLKIRTYRDTHDVERRNVQIVASSLARVRKSAPAAAQDGTSEQRGAAQVGVGAEGSCREEAEWAACARVLLHVDWGLRVGW